MKNGDNNLKGQTALCFCVSYKLLFIFFLFFIIIITLLSFKFWIYKLQISHKERKIVEFLLLLSTTSLPSSFRYCGFTSFFLLSFFFLLILLLIVVCSCCLLMFFWSVVSKKQSLKSFLVHVWNEQEQKSGSFMFSFQTNFLSWHILDFGSYYYFWFSHKQKLVSWVEANQESLI